MRGGSEIVPGASRLRLTLETPPATSSTCTSRCRRAWRSRSAGLGSRCLCWGAQCPV